MPRDREKQKEYAAKWQKANRDKVREAGRKWDEANREKRNLYYMANRKRIAENQRKRIAENPEKDFDRRKKYRLENAEKLRLDNASYLKNNPAAAAAAKDRSKQWQKDNSDHVAEINKKYRSNNASKLSEYHRKYAKENASLRAELSASRRAAKLMATPHWADKAAIRLVYAQAAAAGLTVDHIVPLRGKNVCGLHVENNLQLMTMSENSRKWNLFNG
ncbi:MAG: hypothetical protein NUV42_01180 [Candidatus Yonathbacteria bacterium]|nr:hypothetical protein [Candidatus Yonathbacteria bacterium]